MIVVFRSSEANLSPGSLGSGLSNVPRWNGKYKLEILRKSYLSLQSGLDENDKIIIINDRTTEDTITWMRDNTKAVVSIINISSLDDLRKNHVFPDYHPVIANECTELMEALVQISSDNLHELIYVCEDDYLHTPEAITTMKKIFKSYRGFYVPYDYPDRYTIDKNRSTEVLLGLDNHYRRVPSATLTIAALGLTWLQYKYELLRSGVFADDSWTWKAFAQVGAICPIPGQATHLQDGCITPYINWEEIYDNI